MSINTRKNFGKSLKKFRKEKGFTQEQLALRCGIDYKYLQEIEGKNPPNISIDMIEKLAKGLEIQIYQLFEFW